MLEYNLLNELLHLISTISYLSRDIRMYFNLIYSLLLSQKVSVLQNQKFSLSGRNHRGSTSSGAHYRAGSSGIFRFSPALSPLSSKRRRPLSPDVSDHDSYKMPLHPHPVPSTSSSTPAKKKNRKNSQSSVDVAAVMQSSGSAITTAPTFS